MRGFRWFTLPLSLFFVAGLCAAQNPFPREPADAQSQQQQSQTPSGKDVTAAQIEPPTIRVNTSVVLVPTLVEDHLGQVVYGLKPSDFVLLDNGVKQKVRVDEEMDTEPVSLVICLQRSRDAVLEFDKFARLGPLLQLFTGGNQGDVALVVFDSKPVYLEGFQEDTSWIERDLQQLPEGDGGAAILDAVGFSVNLLEHQPPDRRRVLLLISETRDHGSRHITIPQLVERIGTSNTLVFSVSFSPSKAELMDWAKGNSGGGTNINLMGALLMTVNAMRRNVPKSLAKMSGVNMNPLREKKGLKIELLKRRSMRITGTC